jgi:gluconate 5-dehydrogenase/3-oxoacyl-[acyl-carrier protein] reductase
MTSSGSKVLAGQCALVFGGTAGIGFACARGFAEAGADRVMVVGRDPQRAESAANELRRLFPHHRIEASAADASTPDGAEKGVAACIDAFGRVDILMSTAGGDSMPALFHDIPIDQIPGTVDGIIMSAMLPARAALPEMMGQGGGVILTLASDAGKIATPGETAIGAAMGGIIMFTRALAIEAKRSGVRVNCLTPSIVQGTALYDKLMADAFAGKLFRKAETLAALGVVQPEDLAATAVFLASPSAARITGQAISVNGGISAA